MKKFLVILLVSIFALALATSCKTADCPAYSKVTTEQSTDVPA